MTKPSVSITIISYNQAQYLRMALDSAVAQDYEPLEIVAADDASTDGSREILMSYAERFPGKVVPLVNQGNLGLAGNRDRAMSACSGDFIAWLDADDLAYPYRISRQVEFMEKAASCSISYHDMQVIRGTEVTVETLYGGGRPALEGDHRVLLRNENFIISSSVMIRAGLLPRRGYSFEHGQTYSDYHFFVRMARLGRIGFLNEVLGGYRRHPQSATGSARQTRSGVRRRRALALNAMYREFREERPLLRYCLARFHLSQLSGAARERDPWIIAHSTAHLIGLFPETLEAFRDRRRNRYLLPSFEP